MQKGEGNKISPVTFLHGQKVCIITTPEFSFYSNKKVMKRLKKLSSHMKFKSLTSLEIVFIVIFRPEIQGLFCSFFFS